MISFTAMSKLNTMNSMFRNNEWTTPLESTHQELSFFVGQFRIYKFSRFSQFAFGSERWQAKGILNPLHVAFLPHFCLAFLCYISSASEPADARYSSLSLKATFSLAALHEIEVVLDQNINFQALFLVLRHWRFKLLPFISSSWSVYSSVRLTCWPRIENTMDCRWGSLTREQSFTSDMTCTFCL